MTRRLSLLALLILILPLGNVACDGSPSSALRGQSNSTLTFYGRAVDENGLPLQGAKLDFEIESIPKGWTFDARGKPHDYTSMPVVSGPDGTFRFDLTGHVLRVKEARRDGYRHLHDESGNNSGFNLGYMITDWGRVVYQSNADNPAVYVFVKEGVNEVAALPCGGGSKWQGGRWVVNMPAWPKYPSLKDVVRKNPTIMP